MRKIIFLDIDGVLNSSFWNEAHQREISDGSFIDLDKVNLLSTIVKQTAADIVLHSGWRFWFDSDLKATRKESLRLAQMFERTGISIYDMTPDFCTEEIRETKRFSLIKAKEILDWVHTHQEVEKWIVIDDLDLHNDEIEKRQIRTDSSVGLTQRDVEMAIKMLY